MPETENPKKIIARQNAEKPQGLDSREPGDQ